MFSAKNLQLAKQIYFILYNATGLFTALYLLNQFMPEMLGLTDPVVNSYARRASKERLIFRFLELLMLLEITSGD